MHVSYCQFIITIVTTLTIIPLFLHERFKTSINKLSLHILYESTAIAELHTMTTTRLILL